ATALDMASRVPGFTLENGDEEVRGFAGAVGNVVINGARPSAKAETLENIVLNEAGSGLSGSAELAARHVYTGHVAPAGSLSLVRRSGAVSLGVSASYADQPAPDYGYD